MPKQSKKPVKPGPPTKPRARRKADQYDDPAHDQLKFWQGRDYDRLADEVALHKLLRDKHFQTAADVGGSFGRLSVLLENYADDVTLAEPSRRQLEIAKDFLRDHPGIKQQLMQADDLRFPDGSIDLLIMIRVMNHLPDPDRELREIARVLSPGGYAVIEVANYLHIRNRLKHLRKRERMPVKAVDIRSPANRRPEEIAYVNHNPYTVLRQLEHAGLQVEATLSVSNLRSARLKRVMPQSVMLGAESLLQRPLARVYFGPSIFFLVRKAPAS